MTDKGLTAKGKPRTRAPGAGRPPEIPDAERHNVYVSGADWDDASKLFKAAGSNVSAEIRGFLAAAAAEYRKKHQPKPTKSKAAQ